MSAARCATRREPATPIVERWHVGSEDAWHAYAQAFDRSFRSAAQISLGERHAQAHAAGLAALEQAGYTYDPTATDPEADA